MRKKIPLSVKRFFSRRLQYLIVLLLFSANLFSQISIDVKNKPVKEILKEIERKSSFNFFYSEDLKDLDKITSISVSDASLEKTLDALLKGTSIVFSKQTANIVLLFPKGANPVADVAANSITGTITDAAGEAIIGASVSVKGTTTGTATDVAGKFSLTAAPGAVLIISYIGYKTQEIAVGNNTRPSITLLEDAQSLEEVVVVGFGTQKKINLTGAVGTINAKDIQNRPVQNVQQALQGLIPGLNIAQTNGLLDDTPSINIRGTGNLGTGSSATPLVLIDGVEGNLSFVNPQDIENISVLKDAAASSIYGSRAPFGVILITTKKGTAGVTKVNYNNNFRFASPINMNTPMDSYTLATWLNDGLMNSNASPYFTEEHLKRIKDYQNGTLTSNWPKNPANPAYWDSNGYTGNANFNIYKLVYKDVVFSQEHNVSASGGTSKFTYYMSLGYLDQNGLLKVAKDNSRKFTPMLKVESQVTDWLKLSYTTRFIRNDYSRPSYLTGGMYGDLGRQGWAFLPLIDDNGNYSRYSPLGHLAKRGRADQQTDNFNNHAALALEPVKNWVTTVEFNYNTQSIQSKWATLVRHGYDVAGNPDWNDMPFTDSSVGNFYWKNNFMNMNAYSTYNYSLNDAHHFTLLAGAQLEQLRHTEFELSRSGVIVEELLEVDITSGLDYRGTAVPPSVKGGSAEWSTAGYFGRFNYDYKGRYLLEANFRYDGTSRFRREQRWNWFPSFSAGWNIAREGFWSDLENTVNVLKLRGSYGRLGNQNTDSWYPTYQVISVGTSAGTWIQNGARPNVAYSPNLISSSLTWEKVNTWNAGVDVAAFKNRLTGMFDYYTRKTLDMVGPALELPNTLGKAVPRSNNTDLKTYGFELELGWQDRLKNGLQYGVKFLLSDYQTEITRYPNATRSLSTYMAGQKLGTIWGYETIGIAKSDEEMQAHIASLPNGGQNALGSNWLAGDIMYKDLNGDGKINSGSYTMEDHGDLKLIGNTTPRFQFGLDLNVAWKGFDVRIFFQGVGKRDYWTSSPFFFGYNSSGFWSAVGLKDHIDYFRLQPSNDLPANIDSYYPRPLSSGASKNQQAQTRYLQNASYIRLKNLSVGYTIPQPITRNFSVNELRFFVSGENLWTGTKLATMFDPESVFGAHGTGDQYPLQRTLSFGLTVTL